MTFDIAMNKPNQDRYQQHNEIWLLLPWYANGSLDPDERRQVEKHAEICIACKREMNNQKLLLEKVRQPDAMDIASAASFNKLQQQMQRNSRSNSGIGALLGRLGLPFASHGKNAKKVERPLARPEKTLVMAALSIVVVTPLIAYVGLKQDTNVAAPASNQFRTLSSKSLTKMAGNQIRLVLREDIEQSAITGWLATVGKIEKTKGVGGMVIYTLSVNDPSQVRSLVARLRAHPDVLLAEAPHAAPVGVGQ